MRKFLYLFFATTALWCIDFKYTNAQCIINLAVSADTIDCGENVTITATGFSSSAFLADFNNGLDSGWVATPGCTSFTNPCGPGSDGTPYFWFTDACPQPREDRKSVV